MQTRFTYLACIPMFHESIYHVCFNFKAEHVFSSLFKSSSISAGFGFLVTSINLVLLTFGSGIVVRNTLVTYDRENDKLGFLKTNCSDLWRRLAAPESPAPTSPISQNKSSNISPSPAKSESPTTDLPGSLALYVSMFMVAVAVAVAGR